MHKRTSTAIPEIIPLKWWVIWWVSDKADIPAVPAICLLCVGYLGHPHTSLCCVRECAESIFNAGNASQWQTTNKSVNKRDILMRAKLEKPSKYILHHPVCQTHHDLSCIQWMPYLLFIYESGQFDIAGFLILLPWQTSRKFVLLLIFPFVGQIY